MAIRVLSRVRHSGAVYKLGDIVDGINAKDEKRLIDLGVAERVAKPKNAGKDKGSSNGPDSGNGGGNNGQNPEGDNDGGPK